MKRINILESQIRLITEGMTDVTYHYCSFDSLYNILKDGDIKLTMSSNAADSYHKTKMFYLSTQRSKSTKLGYARNSKNECRIELDGYQLKADGYEAMPVDYWGASMGKQSDIGLGSSRMKIQFGERTPETQKDKEDILKSQGTSSNFEFEDRIFSDKPFMPLKYIKRIDCFTPNASSPSYMTISKSILKLAEEKNVGVFFYSNEKDFILQTNNTINGSIMTSEGQYTEEEPVKSDEYKIKRYVIELVATLCGMLFFFDAFDDELNNKTLVVLKKFGLDDFYDSVIEILPKKKMWADDLCYSMSNDIRKLNTDRFMKTKFSNNVMLLGQYVLRTYGVNNFMALKRYFDKRRQKEVNNEKEDNEIQDSVKCVMISYSYDWNQDYDIKEGNHIFWQWFHKEQFYDEITRQLDDDEWNQQFGEQPLITHKSKNNESFKKYLQHLMHNDNLSLYDGSAILCKIYNNNWEKMGEAFGYIVRPIKINRNNYFTYEQKISFTDRSNIENKLFRNFEDSWQCRQANKVS